MHMRARYVQEKASSMLCAPLQKKNKKFFRFFLVIRKTFPTFAAVYISFSAKI
jgi:hypothetical protein